MAGSIAGASRVASAFARSIMDGDPGAAVAHVAEGGVLLTPDGTAVSGQEAIRAILDQITSSQIALQIRVGRTLEVGSTALATQFWRRKGERFTVETTASLVLTRERSRWAIAIAAPWG